MTTYRLITTELYNELTEKGLIPPKKTKPLPQAETPAKPQPDFCWISFKDKLKWEEKPK